MTAEEFQKHESNRFELSELLKKPILRTALDVLMAELEPSTASTAKLNPVLGASLYQQIAGANHIVLGLDRLTKEFRKPIVPRGKTLAKAPPLPD